MLTPQEQELVSSFVDGEISYRRRKATARLLHRSAEARALLAELREASLKLKKLPPRKLEGSLASAILSQIEQRGLEPQIPRPIVKFHVSRRVQYAVAASLLFFVVTLLYLNLRAALVSREPVANGPLALVTPQLRLEFPDLAKDAKHSMLVEALRKEKAIHLDVAVQSQSVAIERLQDVLRDNGVRVLVNPAVDSTAKKETKPAQYIVYAENLKPEELTKILDGLAQSNGANFKALAFAPLAKEDNDKLSGWIGAGTNSALRTSTTAKKGLFNPTMIERPDGVRDTAQQDDLGRFALVFSSDSAADTLPESMQAFLASRQAQRPGTMQVLFVIHQA